MSRSSGEVARRSLLGLFSVTFYPKQAGQPKGKASTRQTGSSGVARVLFTLLWCWVFLYKACRGGRLNYHGPRGFSWCCSAEYVYTRTDDTALIYEASFFFFDTRRIISLEDTYIYAYTFFFFFFLLFVTQIGRRRARRWHFAFSRLPPWLCSF